MDAGADLDKILVIDEGNDLLTLSDDRIERAIIQNQAKLFIVDPIQAFIGEKVDMNRANEVRPILRNLSDVAQRTGCAIVLIGHLSKSEGAQVIHRGLGSIDLAAGMRSILFVSHTRDDPNLRVLAHGKSSLAPAGDSIAFILGDESGFRWVGTYDITADELMNGIRQKEPTKLQQAQELIIDMTANGRKALSADIDKEAIARNISLRTLRVAKKNLGSALKSKRIEGHKTVFWME